MYDVLCVRIMIALSVLHTQIGEFGIVYKGFVKSALNEVISDTVAVKTLRGEAVIRS